VVDPGFVHLHVHTEYSMLACLSRLGSGGNMRERRYLMRTGSRT
jgi:hypothetical protein